MKKILIVLFVLIVLISFYAHFKMTTSKPEVLLTLVDEIEEYIQYRDVKNTDVSQVDVAWQLDHSLKTINRVSEQLVISNPDNYKSSINLGRVFTLTGGYIPRGVAQSPEIVRPPEVIRTKDLRDQIAKAREQIENYEHLSNDSYFEHFAFGLMNKSQTIRFLEVHTKHHLKIVRDILKE